MRVIAGSEVFAIAFNVDRNFLRSSTNWKQRRPDKHLLQYRTEASPSSCVRCRLLVPFTILSVSLVCYYYFFLHLNALVVLNISSVTDKGQTGGQTGAILCSFTVFLGRRLPAQHLPRLAFKKKLIINKNKSHPAGLFWYDLTWLSCSLSEFDKLQVECRACEGQILRLGVFSEHLQPR